MWQSYIQQQEEGQTKLKLRVMTLEETCKAQSALMSTTEQALIDVTNRLSTVDAASEEIADIAKVKQRIQQLNQTIQSLHEQLIQIKKQSTEFRDQAMYSRNTHRSSSVLHPAVLGMLNRKSRKSVRRLFFIDPSNPQSPNLNTPPRLATQLQDNASVQPSHPVTPTEQKVNIERTNLASEGEKCVVQMICKAVRRRNSTGEDIEKLGRSFY